MSAVLSRSRILVAQLVRVGKRSLAVALLAVVLGATTVPASAFDGQVQYVTHPTDGQPDSPLVP
jgi:hypothetical protein